MIVSTEDTQDIKSGDFLSLGSKCELEVVKSTKDRIVLDSNLCEETQYLEVGRTILLMNEASIDKTNSSSNARLISFNQTKATRPEQPTDMSGFVTKGVRIGFSKADLKGTEKNASGSFSSDVDTKYTLGLGYAHIPSDGGLGGIVDLKYTVFDEGIDLDTSATRLEASLASGFNKYVYFQAGLNLNKYAGTSADSSSSEFGHQVGMGVQFTPNVGADLKIIKVRNNGRTGPNTFEFEMNGTELGLNATF